MPQKKRHASVSVRSLFKVDIVCKRSGGKLFRAYLYLSFRIRHPLLQRVENGLVLILSLCGTFQQALALPLRLLQALSQLEDLVLEEGILPQPHELLGGDSLGHNIFHGAQVRLWFLVRLLFALPCHGRRASPLPGAYMRHAGAGMLAFGRGVPLLPRVYSERCSTIEENKWLARDDSNESALQQRAQSRGSCARRTCTSEVVCHVRTK